MTKEEFSELKPGEVVWFFKIEFSLSGNVSLNIIAKLEKREKENQFSVLQVDKGVSWKKGHIVEFSKWRPEYTNLFKDYREGVDHWNSIVLNTVDRITSKYEQTIKRVKNKLLDKE